MPKNYNIVRIPKKGSNSLLAVLLVLLIVFIVGLGFYLSKSKNSEEKNNRAMGGPEKEEQVNIEKANESQKENNKKEKTKNKKEDKTANKNSYEGNYFSVSYPSDWQAQNVNNMSVNFFSQGSSKDNGEISISYKENKKGLPIERFYDGINDINLFEDATGGFERTKVAGYDAYKFKDLAGETNSTIMVVKLNKAFIEISDNYNKHQSDGVFNDFISSLKVK